MQHQQSWIGSAERCTFHLLWFWQMSSVSAMLQKLPLDSLQQLRARSRVLMLYRIWNGLVAIPAAAYLEPISICTRRFKTRCVQIQCNTGTYSQTYASAVRLWNTLPVGICQLPGNSSKTHLCSFHFIWAPDDFLFLLSALHCFYPKFQFIVCCMASSIHICLLMVWYCSKSSCTVIRRWRWIVAKLLKWRQDLMTILTLCALHALYTLLVYLSMTVIVCPSLLKSQINCNLCL